MSTLVRVILHCSATPDFKVGDANFDLYGARDIDEWHKERGWNGIGYHFVIRRDGAIETGRPLQTMGAHVKGHNEGAIGVCYIGTEYPTEKQVKSIVTLYRVIKERFKISPTDWKGHYEYTNKKTCPGFSMNILRALLEASDKKEDHGLSA